jgi:hypothetical protein
MKKLGALSLVLLLVAGALAADDGLAVSGDARTGLVFEKVTDTDPQVYLGGNEGIPGRVQLNFAYTKGDFLMKWTSQFEGDEQLSAGLNQGKYTLDVADDLFSTAYGAAAFLDGQFRLSVGKLGDAVWASGGDDGGNDLDNVSGFRFELIPNLVSGLDLGFFVPASFGVSGRTASSNPDGAKLDPANFFAEMGFGAKYALDGVIDIRVAFKGDSEDDATYDGRKYAWEFDDGGATLIYGADLKFLGALVPNFSVWLNGKIAGIKTNDFVPDTKGNTTHWVNITYNPDPLSIWARAALETWADNGKTWTGVTGYAKSAVYAKAGVSYAVTPWLKPAIGTQFTFYSYEDSKVGTEDAAAFGEFWIEPSVALSLGNGLTVTPLLNIKANPANSPDAGKDDAKITTLFKISLTYEF